MHNIYRIFHLLNIIKIFREIEVVQYDLKASEYVLITEFNICTTVSMLKYDGTFFVWEN